MTKRVVMSRGGRLQTQKERGGSWTKAKRTAFLAELGITLNIQAACRKVKMGRSGLYALRRRDAGFRAEMGQVIADAYEQLELKYLERGVHGVKRPVFQGGRKVGEIIEYPDKVAMTLLRAHGDTAARAREATSARADEIALAKLRLAEKLSDMNRRMGGNG